MKTINATFFIKEENRQDFLDAFAPLIASSRKEAGNHGYQLYQALDDPNQFLIVEKWQDQAAIDSHNQTPEFVNFFEQLPNFSSAEAIVSIME